MLFGADNTPAPAGEDLADAPDTDVEHELKLEQAEIATDPGADAAQLLDDLRARRRELIDSAAARGVRVAAIGTSPYPGRPTTTPDERYERMERHFGLIAREQLSCGQHVHVLDRVARRGRRRPRRDARPAARARRPRCQLAVLERRGHRVRELPAHLVGAVPHGRATGPVRHAGSLRPGGRRRDRTRRRARRRHDLFRRPAVGEVPDRGDPGERRRPGRHGRRRDRRALPRPGRQPRRANRWTEQCCAARSGTPLGSGSPTGCAMSPSGGCALPRKWSTGCSTTSARRSRRPVTATSSSARSPRRFAEGTGAELQRRAHAEHGSPADVVAAAVARTAR